MCLQNFHENGCFLQIVFQQNLSSKITENFPPNKPFFPTTLSMKILWNLIFLCSLPEALSHASVAKFFYGDYIHVQVQIKTINLLNLKDLTSLFIALHCSNPPTPPGGGGGECLTFEWIHEENLCSWTDFLIVLAMSIIMQVTCWRWVTSKKNVCFGNKSMEPCMHNHWMDLITVILVMTIHVSLKLLVS